MKDYRVKVKYTFAGWYDITAKDEQQARMIAEQDCGLAIGAGIHTSNDMHVRDWEFNIHPEKWIGSTRQTKQQTGRAEVRL